MPFDNSNLGSFARYKPVKDKDQIDLYWDMPYLKNEYKSNPLSYYTHLIGHEGENSLLSYLKAEDYAMELSTYADHNIDC